MGTRTALYGAKFPSEQLLGAVPMAAACCGQEFAPANSLPIQPYISGRPLQVPVVSVAVPVDPSGEYAGLPHFVQFGDAISFVGGINMPKLVQCFDRRAFPFL